MEHKIFGVPEPGVVYGERRGAYGVVFDEMGNVAVIYNRQKGYFLLGGGLEGEESHAVCIRREALEETGYAVSVGELVCTGEEYVAQDLSGAPLHAMGSVYLVELDAPVAEPTEPDHYLVWLPAESCAERMFLKYQAWAVETAWEIYQKGR